MVQKFEQIRGGRDVEVRRFANFVLQQSPAKLKGGFAVAIKQYSELLQLLHNLERRLSKIQAEPPSTMVGYYIRVQGYLRRFVELVPRKIFQEGLEYSTSEYDHLVYILGEAQQKYEEAMIELKHTKANSFNTISHKEQKEILQTLKKDRTEKEQVVGELRKKMMNISTALRLKLNELRDGMCKLRELDVPEDLPQDVKDLAHTIKAKANAYCKAKPTLDMLKKGAKSNPFEFESLHEDDQKDSTYHPKPDHIQTHLTALKKLREAHEKGDRKRTKEATTHRTRRTKRKNQRDAWLSRTYTLDSSEEEEEEEHAQQSGSGGGGRSVTKKAAFPKASKEETISLLEEEEEEEDLASMFQAPTTHVQEEEDDLSNMFPATPTQEEEDVVDLSNMFPSMQKFKWTPTFSARPAKAKAPRSSKSIGSNTSKKSKKKRT